MIQVIKLINKAHRKFKVIDDNTITVAANNLNPSFWALVKNLKEMDAKVCYKNSTFEITLK